MKAIGVKYVRAKHKELNNGQDMVIQTGWMQLVGMDEHSAKMNEAKKVEKCIWQQKMTHISLPKPMDTAYISVYIVLLTIYLKKKYRQTRKPFTSTYKKWLSSMRKI